MTERRPWAGVWPGWRGPTLGALLLLCGPARGAPRPEPRPPPPPPAVVAQAQLEPDSVVALARQLGSDSPGEARYAARELGRRARAAARLADHGTGDRALEGGLVLLELESLVLLACVEALADRATALPCADLLVAVQSPLGIAPLDAAAQNHGGALGRRLERRAAALRAAQLPPKAEAP